MTSPHASASRFDLRALLGAAVLCAAVSAAAAPYYVGSSYGAAADPAGARESLAP